MEVVISEYSDKYKHAAKELIISILEGEFGHYNIDRPDLDTISSYYQTNGGNFWLAFYGGRVIGTVGLKDYNGKAYLQRMMIRKDFRGTGVAQKLLSEVINFAKSVGFSEIYLATSLNLEAANRFYHKHGFKKIKQLPSEIPTPIAKIYYKKEI